MTIDEKILSRVRGLLAKAEATDFEEEAAAFTAKAQELMARHAIDEAVIDQHRSRAEQGSVTSRVILVERPYAGPKTSVLAAAAHPNRCVVVRRRQPGDTTCTVFGYRTDLDIVEVLYTSLLLQAGRAMLLVEHAGEREGGAKSFRHAFLQGFAARIGARLTEAAKAAADEARAAAPGTDLVPVLAHRTAQVHAAVQATYGRLGSSRPSASNRAGLVAGMAAADRADIGDRGVEGGLRSSLPG